MNPSCLDNCLTDQQRDHFERLGYLTVSEAVPVDRLRRIERLCERMLAEKRGAGLGVHTAFSQGDVVGRDPAIVEMIDCAATFPKVWGILGWNIYLYHSHLDVTPSADPQRDPTEPTVAWHQDSLRVNDELESSPRPRLSLKIGYAISDLSEPGRGNTLIVPSSHLHDEIDVPTDGQSNPSGAEPVCLTAGSAVIIDRRIWHSRSVNHSAITRKVLWMGYSYRWLRPKDEMNVEHLFPQLTPIQRQILGGRESNNGYYAPTDADVPLRGWLREQGAEGTAGLTLPQRQSFRPDIANLIVSTPQGAAGRDVD